MGSIGPRVEQAHAEAPTRDGERVAAVRAAVVEVEAVGASTALHGVHEHAEERVLGLVRAGLESDEIA